MDPAQQPLQPADLRGTLLLRDCLGAEGAFLLVQLVKAAVGSGPAPAPPAAAHPTAAATHVVLLAAAQAASHYTAVLRKAGLNCPALVEAGRLTMVEAVPGHGGLPSLRDLHKRLAAAAAGGCSDGHAGGGSRPMVLVVDDLTVRGCWSVGDPPLFCALPAGRPASLPWRCAAAAFNAAQEAWPATGNITPPTHTPALQALRCLANSEADWAAFLQACTALGQVRCMGLSSSLRLVAQQGCWVAPCLAPTTVSTAPPP